MCSCAHLVYLVHLLALGASLMLVRQPLITGLDIRRYSLFVTALALVLAGFVVHVSNPVLPFMDFRKAYWPAGAAALQGEAALREVMRHGAFGFVNLPIVAYLFALFGAMPETAAAWSFTVVGAAAVLAAFGLLVKAAALDRQAVAVLAVVFAAFGPLAYSIREGNTSHIVLAMLIAALLALRRRRGLLAGALLGLAALIKLPLMLFGVYYVLRGRWRVVAGGAAVVGGAAGLSLLVFGWDLHVFWYEVCIRPYARDPVGALNVQSVAAALARLEFGPPTILDWERRTLAPALALLAATSTFALIGLAMAAAAGRTRAGEPQVTQELEFMIVLMLAAIISPLSWSHYYVWMLLPAAFFISRAPHFGGGRLQRLLGWVAIVIASPPVLFWQPGPRLLNEAHARLGVSHLLYGGLILLGVLLVCRWRAGRDGAQVRLGAPPAEAPA